MKEGLGLLQQVHRPSSIRAFSCILLYRFSVKVSISGSVSSVAPDNDGCFDLQEQKSFYCCCLFHNLWAWFLLGSRQIVSRRNLPLLSSSILPEIYLIELKMLLFFWGASLVRLASEGSSMLTLILSARRPALSMRRGSAPGMALTCIYP